MGQKEIFFKIALAIKEILPKDISVDYSVLEIKRLTGNIGFTGYYIVNGEKKWLDIFKFHLEEEYIEELYLITQNAFPVHINWNRAEFTLHSTGKVEIEYIWDQELYDQVYGKE